MTFPPTKAVLIAEAEKYVTLLADQSMSAGLQSNAFYGNLIQQLNLPRPVRVNRLGALTGVADFDARGLLHWAIDYGTNPNDNVGVLGSIAMSMIPLAGVEDATRLASFVVACRLVPPARIDELRTRFQIPQPLGKPADAPAATGPAFDWKGPAEEVQLQGLLWAEPEFIEIALLQKAVHRARSVCLIEVPGNKEKGTGVLIADNLVLTNYHVLTGRPEDMLANARTATLRFGAFTSAKPGASPADGQVIGLHAAEPVKDASPVADLDFVLLQTDGTRPVDSLPTPPADLTPAADSAMHILQHPHGGVMMLAMSKNGVTTVDTKSGKIQYVTRSAGGSSGSPCFNENWELVALHHAEVQKTFGAVREGILMSSILGRIRKFL